MKKYEIIKALNDKGYTISEGHFYFLQRQGFWQKNASFEDIENALITLKSEKQKTAYERVKNRLTDGNA